MRDLAVKLLTHSVATVKINDRRSSEMSENALYFAEK